MQISPVNNHKHQSFGVRASSYVQQVLSRGITTDSFDFPTFFKNTEKLANNLSKVGSKNTSLEKFQITRGFLDDFSKDNGIIADTVSFTLKTKNPDGKIIKKDFSIVSLDAERAIPKEFPLYEQSKGENFSSVAGRDIYKEFSETVDEFEQDIINKYAKKMTHRAQLYLGRDRLVKLFPNQKPYIDSVVELLGEKHMEMKQKLAFMSPIGKFFHNLFG